MAYIPGTSGNDTLTQNDGEDDVIDGLDGFDTIDFSVHGEGVTVNLNNNAAQMFSSLSGMDTLVSIEHATGSGFADLLIADSGGSRLTGLDGDDTLIGRGSIDILQGGNGDDVLLGRQGADQLHGGSGSDFVRPGLFENGAFAELDYATGGHDFFITGIDTLDLSQDISADVAANGVSLNTELGTVASQNGFGTYLLFDGFEKILLTDGNDTVQTDQGDGVDAIYGNGGDDVMTGGFGDDTFFGGAGNDTLNGRSGDDYIHGQDGDDTLIATHGTNIVHGGDGSDTLDYSIFSGDKTVSLRSRMAFDAFSQGSSKLYSVENITSNSGNDTLIGDDGDNIINAGADNDVLIGLEGSDTLHGGSGDDVIRSVSGAGGGAANTIDGGTGKDTLDYRDFDDGIGSAGVVVDAHAGTASYVFFAGAGLFNDTFTGIEQIFGSNQVDTITASGSNQDWLLKGRGSNDTITGGDGDDTLIGDEGDDNLQGGAGNDVLLGGVGKDALDGGDGDDLLRPLGSVSYTNQQVDGGAGIDTLDLVGFGNYSIVNITNGSGAVTFPFTVDNHMVLSGIENVRGDEQGNEFQSTRTDGIGVILWGEDGNDILKSYSNAADKFFGGAGNDAIRSAHSRLDIGNYIDGGASTPTSGAFGGDILDYRDFQDMANVGLRIELSTRSSGRTKHLDDLATTLDTFNNIETIYGSLLDDVIIDKSGNGSAALVIDGLGGNDLIQDGDGASTLFGGNGDDTILAGGGTDIIRGGNGDDYVRTSLTKTNPTDANIFLEGGANTDTLDVSPFAVPSVGLIFDFTGASYNGTITPDDASGTAIADIFNFEYYNLTDEDDFFNGGALTAPVYVDGNAGADQITTGSGNDGLLGGDGNDALEGGAGADQIYGGNGIDNLYATNDDGSADIYDGGASRDRLTYFSSTDGVTVNLNLTGPQMVSASQGTDTIRNIENVSGSSFADTLRGTTGFNVLSGNSGDDFLFGNGGGDRLIGETGNDTIYGGGGADEILGLSGNDIIHVNVFNPAGILKESGSADLYDGGAGTDTLSFENATQAITINLAQTSAQMISAEQGSDTVRGIENVIGTDQGDTINGNGSSNDLSGGDGNDTLSGSAGNDRLDGGDGNDTVTYAGASAAITVDLSQAMAQTISAAEGNDTLISIENVIGSSHDDTLSGNGGDNVLDGGNGSDTVDYSGSADAVDVDLRIAIAQAVSASQGSDTLLNIEHLIGSAFDDILRGNDADNVLTGGVGGDRLVGYGGDDSLIGGDGGDDLWGGGGADHLQGGDGNDELFSSTFGASGADKENGSADIYDGGTGTDRVNFRPSSTGVEVDLSVVGPQLVSAEQGTDTFISIEEVMGSNFDDTLTAANSVTTLIGYFGNDTINGGSATDLLYGDAGNDVISGGGGGDFIFDDGVAGGGADILNGGDGDDTISRYGGADTARGEGGADTFRPMAIDDTNRFIILDFETNIDTLDLQTGLAADHFSQLIYDGFKTEIVAFDASNNVLARIGIDNIAFGGFNTADILI